MELLAVEISELAQALAPETERQRQLAGELLLRLRASGLMMAGAPREVGGLELAPGVALRCAEEVARGDASAGWCVSIAATSSLLAAYLPAESRDQAVRRPAGDRGGNLRPPWEGASGRRRGDRQRAVGLLQRDHARRRTVRGLLRRGRRSRPATRGRDPTALPCSATSSRSWTHGTRSASAAPEATMPLPTSCSFRRRACCACSTAGHPAAAVPLPGLRLLRAVDSGGGSGQRARRDRGVLRAGRTQGRAGLDPHAGRTLDDAGGGCRGGGVAARGAGTVLRGDRGSMGGGAGG